MKLLGVERQRQNIELEKAFQGRPGGQVTSSWYHCCTRDYGHLCECVGLLGYSYLQTWSLSIRTLVASNGNLLWLKKVNKGELFSGNRASENPCSGI